MKGTWCYSATVSQTVLKTCPTKHNTPFTNDMKTECSTDSHSGHKIFTFGQQNTPISSLANDLHWSYAWENLNRSHHHANFEGSCLNNTQDNANINAFAMSPRASVTSVRCMPKSGRSFCVCVITIQYTKPARTLPRKQLSFKTFLQLPHH